MFISVDTKTTHKCVWTINLFLFTTSMNIRMYVERNVAIMPNVMTQSVFKPQKDNKTADHATLEFTRKLWNSNFNI